MKKVILVIALILVGAGLYYWVIPKIYTTYFKKPVSQEQNQDTEIRTNIAESKYQLHELQMALEGFYTDNKIYPETLFGLTTPVAYIARIPADPFSPLEAELNYKIIGDTEFLLWGIGPDGKDDSGQLVYNPNNGLTSSGDIIRTPTSK